MKYTGQMLIPEEAGGSTYTEHYARYLFAAQSVKGKPFLMSPMVPAIEQECWQKGKSDCITFHQSPLEPNLTIDAEGLSAGSWKKKISQDKHATRWARCEPSRGNSSSGGAGLGEAATASCLQLRGGRALAAKRRAGDQERWSTAPSPDPFGLAGGARPSQSSAPSFYEQR